MTATVIKDDLEWGDLFLNSDGNPEKYLPCHEYQEQALTSKRRFIACIAGTGGGKTCFAPVWLMKQIERKPKGQFMAVAPNFRMLRNALLPNIEKVFEGTPYQGHKEYGKGRQGYVANRGVYECGTGAIIYLYSTDDPDSMHGPHVDAIVLDEAGKMSEKAWHNARQRSNHKRAPILITSTPYSFNWLYHEVYLPWQSGDKDYQVINFPSTANPTYDRDAFEREKLRLAPWRFAMMYEGVFTRPAGVIYPDMHKCVVEIDDIPKGNHTYIGGMDYGFNDPTAALIGFVEDNVLYVAYEKSERFHTVPEFCDGLPKQIGNASVVYFCDSSRPDSIKEMRKLGFVARKCKKYAGSVADNIDLINGLIRTGRLKIVAGQCDQLLSEADMYSYQEGEREGEYIDKPVDANNHCLDALAYMAQGARRRGLLHD